MQSQSPTSAPTYANPTGRLPYKERGKVQDGIFYRPSRRSPTGKTFYVWDPKERKPARAGYTPQEAFALRQDIRDKRERGMETLVVPRRSFQDVGEEWFASPRTQKLRKTTLQGHRHYLTDVLIPRFGARAVASIVPVDIATLMDEMDADGKSESLRANVLKTASRVFAHAAEHGLIQSNPCSLLADRPTSAVRRPHRPWSTADVQKMIRAGYALDERETSRQKYGLAIELMLRTGLRIGELLALRVEDVDLEARLLLVRRSWNRLSEITEVKTEASVREVPITPHMVQKLAKRTLELDADPESFLFAIRKGVNPPSQGNFRNRGWNKAVKLAGLGDGLRLTPHDARHAVASQLADLGLTANDLAPMLGHATAGITEAIYIHSFGKDALLERQRAAMEQAQGAAA